LAPNVSLPRKSSPPRKSSLFQQQLQSSFLPIHPTDPQETPRIPPHLGSPTRSCCFLKALPRRPGRFPPNRAPAIPLRYLARPAAISVKCRQMRPLSAPSSGSDRPQLFSVSRPKFRLAGRPRSGPASRICRACTALANCARSAPPASGPSGQLRPLAKRPFRLPPMSVLTPSFEPNAPETLAAPNVRAPNRPSHRSPLL
jgi:hypothetical protein